MSDYPPVMFNTNLEEAAAKRGQASRFDGWAELAAALVSGISRDQDGRTVWTGPAADRWQEEFLGSSGIVKEVRKYPEAYHATARNLRATAKDLADKPNRNH
jgi:uncharacterized protein YukE